MSRLSVVSETLATGTTDRIELRINCTRLLSHSSGNSSAWCIRPRAQIPNVVLSSATPSASVLPVSAATSGPTSGKLSTHSSRLLKVSSTRPPKKLTTFRSTSSHSSKLSSSANSSLSHSTNSAGPVRSIPVRSFIRPGMDAIQSSRLSNSATIPPKNVRTSFSASSHSSRFSRSAILSTIQVTRAADPVRSIPVRFFMLSSRPVRNCNGSIDGSLPGAKSSSFNGLRSTSSCR